MKQMLLALFHSVQTQRRLLIAVFMCLAVSMVHTGFAQVTPAITLSASSATVCAGAGTVLTATGCPTTAALRWSTNQTTNPVSVTPTQTTVYSATCTVTTSSVVTTTAISTSAVNATAVSTTFVSSTTALVTNSASGSASITIQTTPGLTLATTPTPAVCNGTSDGRIAVAVTGGTAPFQYQFNNQPFQNESTVSGLRAGMYPVLVRDARGCTARANVTVTQPVPLSLAVTLTSARCAGGDDGGIVAVASGGNGGPFRYLLDFKTDPQATGVFTNLVANTQYVVVAADQRDCIVLREVTIPQPNSFSISLTAQPAKCAGSADGSVAVTVRGGTGALIYRIGNGPFQSGTLFTGLTANTYEVTVQDVNGCQSKSSVTVGQPTPLRLTATSTPINCFGLTSGTASVTASGGTGAVSYRLTTAPASQTSTVFTGLGTGEYTIVGTDANGCTTPVSVTVGRADVLRVQAAMTPATCCVCPTGAVRLSSTGGSGTTRQYQIIGQPNQTNAQFNGLRPNAYRLRVTDEVGCTDTITVRVTDASAMTLTTGTVKNVLCAGGSDGEATVQVAGGTRPFTFFWQTDRRDTLRARTATQTNLTEGTYTVSVLDSNRCTTSTVFVTLRSQFPVPTKPSVQLSGGTLLVDQTTGIQWFVQQGTNPARAVANATRPVLTPFESGQYFVIITANGCASPPSDPVTFVLTASPEPVADFSVRVAPNPVSGGQLHVELEQAGRSPVSLHLLDASGRAVWQQQLPAFTGKKQATWPLTGVATGTYLLKADAESRRAVLRVVIE